MKTSENKVSNNIDTFKESFTNIIEAFKITFALE